MAVFNPNDGMPTFIPDPYSSEPSSTFDGVLEPNKNLSDFNSSLNETVNQFRQSVGIGGNSMPTNNGSQSGLDMSTKDGTFIGVDWNDPDSVIKKAESLLDTNPELAEMLLNYGMSEKSTLAQYNRSLEASNTTFQRMVDDLRKTGLNPFLAISGMSGSAVSSGSNSYGQSSLSNIHATKISTRSAERRTVIAGLSMVLSSILRFGAMLA